MNARKYNRGSRRPGSSRRVRVRASKPKAGFCPMSLPAAAAQTAVVLAQLAAVQWQIRGAGPWNNEPDKAQWVDEVTGLDCLIVRNHSGALCGYVGVPEDHPAYGKDYEDVDVDVHGGLTFAAFCHEGNEQGWGICHVPEPGRPERPWWLGFDCAHCGDFIPDIDREWPLPRLASETYKTFDYVRAECASLASQLAAIGGAS